MDNDRDKWTELMPLIKQVYIGGTAKDVKAVLEGQHGFPEKPSVFLIRPDRRWKAYDCPTGSHFTKAGSEA